MQKNANVEIKPECDVARLMSVMSHGLFLGTLGTPLFVGSFLTVSWAQGVSESPTPPPSFLSAAEITSQFNYSCPINTACSLLLFGRRTIRNRTRNEIDCLL